MPVRRMLAAGLLAVLLAACGLPDQGYRFDDRLETAVAQLVLYGGEVELGRLAALPEGPWERVHVFTVGATAEAVAQAVGRPVLKEPTFTHPGNLLVFTQGERTVAAVAVGGGILPDGTWSAGARIVPLGDRPPHRLGIIEPGTPAPPPVATPATPPVSGG